MSHHDEWIEIHPLAPPKPHEGEPCNGCGVCCLAEPCPLGILLSRKRCGACDALQWDNDRGLYRCGAISQPLAVVDRQFGAWPRWLRRPLASLIGLLAPRWISRGSGCDSDLQIDARFRDNARHD